MITIENPLNIPLSSSGIYCINFCGGSFKYIGQTKVFENRLRQHLRILKTNTHHNSILQKSFNKYGIDLLIFTILETCTEKELSSREIYWAEYYKDCLMNLSCVGTNIPMSDLTRNKIRDKATGRKHSPETRKKIGDVQRGHSRGKGRSLSKEHCENMSKSLKGVKPKITKEQFQKGVLIKRVYLDNKKSGVNYETARKIKEMLPFYSNCVLAEMLGVTHHMVSNIRQGLAWKHVQVDIPEESRYVKPKKRGSYGMLGKKLKWSEETRQNCLTKRRLNLNPTKNLTIQEVIEIKKLFGTGLTNVAIAKKYSVTKSTINRIKNGDTWRGSIEYFENFLKETCLK